MGRITIIDYDGYNLFYKGKWTGLEFYEIDQARQIRDMLIPLDDNEVEAWIAEEQLKKSGKVWNTIRTEEIK